MRSGRPSKTGCCLARALQALSGFKRLIEDARAMLGPGFAEKLAEDVGADGLSAESVLAESSEPDTSFGFGEVETGADAVADTSFDTSFNFGFDFGPSEEISTIAPENATDSDAAHGLDAAVDEAMYNPFAPVVLKSSANEASAAARRAVADEEKQFPSLAEPAPFRKPGDAATLPELIKFLNDRSGYIKALEEEATPESFSRIENLKELANAAQDAQLRGETLHEFLDHAALVSDADQYSAEAQVTLMTLHAAKGLEFPLVFLAGMEEGLFPHSRTLTDPTGLEEERRLCYVGMTRAMDTLVMTRARYRRRYGSDMPEASVASRFLEEVPGRLVEDLGSPPARPAFSGNSYSTPYPKRSGYEDGERHYSYEDESQDTGVRAAARAAVGGAAGRPAGWGRRAEASRSTTSRAFLPGEAAHRAALRGPSWTFPRLRARPGWARGRACAIRNMAREWCFSAKAMGTTPRLQYNFNSTA